MKAALAYMAVMTLVSVAIMPYTGVGLGQALILGPAVGLVIYILDRAMR